MGNYEQLKQAVSNVIKNNGNMEITGDILQNTLLSIISTVGGNATFAGIATPTTNPGTPDQNVFYIASENGTYFNFGGVTLENQVVIFSNANGSWEMTDTVIATEREIIYDVSARNNNAVFESLQALFSSSNLSTLIPESVRCGGMSIRFIQGSEQSSDNKYVQFRLMKNQWSITVSDWQGVDEEPTAGSDNLVKSRGIKSFVEKNIGTVKANGYYKVEVDADSKMLSSLNVDDEKEHHYIPHVFEGGLFAPELDKKLDKENAFTEYPFVEMDRDSKIHHYVKQNGVHGFPAGIELPEVIKPTVIDCWGDSQTGGAYSQSITSWVNVLAANINFTLGGDADKCINNFGNGGENCTEIAIRQGGLGLYIEPFTLAANPNTQNDCTIYSENGNHVPRLGILWNSFNPVEIDGNLCYINESRKVFRANASKDDIVFTRPVRVIPYKAIFKRDTINIIMMGQNGGYNNNIDTYYAIIDSMINNIPEPKKYIIISPYTLTLHNATGLDIDDIENFMASKYGVHYLNIRKYMLDYGLADNNLQETAEDISRKEQGLVSKQLEYEVQLHPNQYGFIAIANAIQRKLVDLKYI